MFFVEKTCYFLYSNDMVFRGAVPLVILTEFHERIKSYQGPRVKITDENDGNVKSL